MLSLSGIEILVKAVIQETPSYAMPVFKLPKVVCKAITDELSNFWWGDNEQSNKMH